MQPILFSIQGQSHGFRNKGIPAILLGRVPLPTTRFTITGVAKDSTGAVLSDVTVTLFRTLDNQPVEVAVSDGAGAYSFSAIGLAEQYFVLAYKAGSPDVSGVTVNTLVGT